MPNKGLTTNGENRHGKKTRLKKIISFNTILGMPQTNRYRVNCNLQIKLRNNIAFFAFATNLTNSAFLLCES